ncbi:zinc/iron-chelating domain-containing protein [Aureibacter tunicatorum]|nr:zinc/iron-chelating domain-containing protein [Aureibacter tunicatorum]
MLLEEFKGLKKENFEKLNDTAKKLRKLKDGKVDNAVHALHDEVFDEIDCLECANCCKTTSPIFLESDIERLAKAFKMKVKDFIDSYLHKDKEGDYVLNEAPCPFLGYDNKCIAYQHRPKACREYPHTNRKRFKQIINLSLTNATICPAVYQIFLKLEHKV